LDLANTYRDKRVLVIGGLGFIGSNLAQRLVQLGAQVLIVDSLVPDHGGNVFNVANIRDKLKVNITDVRDQHAINFLVRGQHYIFNLAGQVSHIGSMEDPQADNDINARSQIYLLEACRQHNAQARVVYTSTRQFYGVPQYLPVDEAHPVEPTDVNGITKWAGEQYHMVYHRAHGIPTTALRLTNVYGPRQVLKDAEGRMGVIYHFVRKVLAREKLKVFGTGEQLRDYVYVDDVVEGLLLAGAHDNAIGQVFNAGGLRPISHLQLVQHLVAAAGLPEDWYDLVPFPPERKAIDVGSVYLDSTKIKNAIGWEPTTGLAEGLAQTFAYYQEHRDAYWDADLVATLQEGSLQADGT
jgi:UDP-glucose 4-epimerase